MNDKILKPLIFAAGLGMASLLASCDEPRYEPQPEQMEVETEEADAAEDAAEDTVAEVVEAPAATPPVDQLPAAVASSEESVQPESETLFY